MSNTLIDLTGQKFGRLTVISKAKPYKTKGGYYATKWICQCECGNVVEVNTQKLRNGHTSSCGCLKKENKGRPKSDLDLINKRFNRLTVVKWLAEKERIHRNNPLLCLCDCGNTIQTNANKLLTGHTKSCGCKKSQMISDLNRKYIYSNKRLYSVYKAMLTRCYDPKDRNYIRYGHRGIKVCDEWLNNYDNFAEWAFSNGYNQNAAFHVCTIDRINVDGNYEPSNCRWISNKEQQQNTRRCRNFEYNGEIHNISKWAEILNIPYNTLYRKLMIKKLPIQEIIETKSI